jgi:hypothetical protein
MILKTILNGVVDDLKAGYPITFVNGTTAENNLNDNVVGMTIELIEPFNYTPRTFAGGRTYTYPSITIYITELDELENTTVGSAHIISRCTAIYEQFIKRLSKVEYIKILSEGCIAGSNFKDANRTGLVCQLSIEQNIIESQCLV